MMNRLATLALRPALVLAPILCLAQAAQAGSPEHFRLYVSNERAGTITVIDAGNLKVIDTIPVGKRPRGIHASPDGCKVYVALSGNPIAGPPHKGAPAKAAGASGQPAAAPGKDDEDESPMKADKSADGIGVIDVDKGKLIDKLLVGSDPEEFALSRSGSELYISNEDVKTASVVDLRSGKIAHVVPIAQEPEGVATAPDGKTFYVTCEAGGQVFVVDASSFQVIGQFSVPPRPRTVAFLQGASIAFIPSETTGQLNVVDTANYKVLRTLDLPPGSLPMSVQISPDSRRVYVSNGRGGTVSVIDSRSYELLNSIHVGTRPWGMVVSPDGKYLYTANGPSDDISVVDLTTDKEIARVRTGESPWGIAIVRAGRAKRAGS